MVTPTLTVPVPPSYGTSKKVKAKVQVAEFGDGYSQRAKDGINNIVDQIPVVWESLTAAQADDLETFLEERGGSGAFFFDFVREPGSGKKWRCEEWERTPSKPDYDRVTATFIRVFDLGD